MSETERSGPRDELLERVRGRFPYYPDFSARGIAYHKNIAAFVREERRLAKIETLEALKEDITPGIDACRQIEGRLAELRLEGGDAQKG